MTYLASQTTYSVRHPDKGRDHAVPPRPLARYSTPIDQDALAAAMMAEAKVAAARQAQLWGKVHSSTRVPTYDDKALARVRGYVTRWGPVGRHQIAVALKMGESTVGAHLSKLAASGRIDRDGGGRYTQYRGVK